MQSTTPMLLTGGQAAKLLSISTRTLWAMTVPRGDLPAVRIGRSVRYSSSDLAAWIERRRQTGGER